MGRLEVAGFEAAMKSWRASLPVSEPSPAWSAEKPKAVPSWVWEEYASTLELSAFRYGSSAGARKECLDVIVRAADPGRVWKPIASRLNSQGEGRRWSLYELSSLVYAVTQETTGHFLYSRSQIVKSAALVSKSANLLRLELVKLLEEAGTWPAPIWRSFSKQNPTELTEEMIFSLLEAISSGAEAWSKSSPLLKKPNQGNGLRTMLIQSVTAYFLEVFGQPLRGATLGITSLFFNCDSLTEAEVSQLAPVPKSK